MVFTKEQFEEDGRRYRAELARLRGLGLSDDHPLVERQIRRIETVELVLSDPACGLAEDAGGEG